MSSPYTGATAAGADPRVRRPQRAELRSRLQRRHRNTDHKPRPSRRRRQLGRSLIGEVTKDLSTLMRQELELAKE